MKTVKSLLIKAFIVLFSSYVIICAGFYTVQDTFIFKPTKLDKGYAVVYDFPFEERNFEVEEGIVLNSILAKADSAKGLIFFCHGNAGSVQTDPARFEVFLDLGYDVIYPDYRGYGKSDGYPESDEQIVSDIDFIYQEMLKEYDEDDITILGYSLGSGIAALLAAEHNPKNVMIWTPYYSMVDMKNAIYPFLPTFLMNFPFRTDLAIPKIDEPITIFYAENDEVLPVDRSIKLQELLKENGEVVILKDQGHNKLYLNEELISKLPEVLNKGGIGS